MTSTFIRHELKAFWRARNAGKSLAIHIVLGILILILFLYVLIAGIFLDKVLLHFFPKDNVMVSFAGIILLYYLLELLGRMQLQELPTLRVQPYLQLAIKRNTLVRYLSFTAMLSFFNLWPLILFIPFLIKVVLIQKGAVASLVCVFALLGFSIFNNYLALYIKRKASFNGWILNIASLAVIALAAGDFKYHLYSVRAFSYGFFGNLMDHPLLVLIPLILAMVMYYVNFLYLKDNLYLEVLTKHKKLKRSTTEFPVLSRFGLVGDLVANELKLILRNKRPSASLKMSAIFLFYGLLAYAMPHSMEWMKIFMGLFMSGIFIINYGQFMYGWQGGHFDGLLVSRVTIKEFLRAKYLLFTLISTAAIILMTPYVYFGWHALVLNFVMYLWNLGVNSTIVLFFANRNQKRIDLSKGAAFNWEGVGITQMLLGFPLMLGPYLIYLPVYFIAGHNHNAALASVAIVSIICIATRSFWIDQLAADFTKRKFKIAEGFRTK